MKGACTPRTLAEDLFCLLRVLWRTHNSDYDELVSKFEADQSGHRRHKRARLPVDGIADWNPEHIQLNFYGAQVGNHEAKCEGRLPPTDA